MNENELEFKEKLNTLLENQVGLQEQTNNILEMVNTLFVALSQNRKAQQADDERIETLYDAVIALTDQINLLTTMIREK